jgi:hypothetical protein
MYQDGEVALKRILELVELCPESLRPKCFEVLLGGYAESQVARTQKELPEDKAKVKLDQKGEEKHSKESDIPATVLPRFKAAAKRLGISLEKLEALFDFSVDPFALQPTVIPGKNIAEKNRNVALFAATRSYFANGSWSADWQEIKKLCLDNNCYDPKNHAVNLKGGVGSLFKNVDSGKPIDLASEGIQEAEKLIKSLAEAPA